MDIFQGPSCFFQVPGWESFNNCFSGARLLRTPHYFREAFIIQKSWHRQRLSMTPTWPHYAVW